MILTNLTCLTALGRHIEPSMEDFGESHHQYPAEQPDDLYAETEDVDENNAPASGSVNARALYDYEAGQCFILPFLFLVHISLPRAEPVSCKKSVHMLTKYLILFFMKKWTIFVWSYGNEIIKNVL